MDAINIMLQILQTVVMMIQLPILPYRKSDAILATLPSAVPPIYNIISQIGISV